jgi:4'-phosphopantetheinyl transferase
MLALTAADFVAARYPVALMADEIQLWFFPARSGAGARFDDDRLRRLLAPHVDCAPNELALQRGEHGKPHLQASAAIEFNLSHSHGAALVGLSRSQALGVDIETRHRSRPVLELARRYFAAGEADALAAIDPAHQQAAFLRLWSCKEAVVKALGRGIGFGLARLAFALDRAGGPARLDVIDASAGSVAEWQIVGLAPTLEHFGAVAWRGPARTLRVFAALPP